MNGHLPRRLDSETNLVPADLNHGDDDVVIDDDAFIFLARQNQHGTRFSEDGAGAETDSTIPFYASTCNLGNRSSAETVVYVPVELWEDKAATNTVLDLTKHDKTGQEAGQN